MDFDRRGYGNFLTIDFGGGWVGWYAHFEVIHVRQGQQVVALQALGVMGATGNVSGPHVHITLTNATIGLDHYVVPKVLDPEPRMIGW